MKLSTKLLIVRIFNQLYPLIGFIGGFLISILLGSNMPLMISVLVVYIILGIIVIPKFVNIEYKLEGKDIIHRVAEELKKEKNKE